MALYAYTCPTCGPFQLRRPTLEAAADAHCPACARPARRVFTPPGVYRTSASTRRVRTLEEKSAHEPDVTTAKRGRPLPHRHSPAPPWMLSH